MRFRYIAISLLLLLFVTVHISANELQNVQATVDLELARELAIKHNRTLRSLGLSVDKLKVAEDQTKDAYTRANVYATWHSQLNYLYHLQEQLAKAIADNNEGEVTRLSTAIATQEAKITVTKTMMNPGANEQLRNAYQDTQDAHKDLIIRKDETEELIAYKVEELYIQILRLEHGLKLLEQTYDMQANRLRIERVRLELGMTSQAEVNKLAVDVSGQLNNIRGLEESIKLLKWQLNDMMGREYNQKLDLAPLKITPSHVIITHADLQNALKNNTSKVTQLERDIKKLEDRLRTDQKYKDDENERKLARIEIEEKELALEDELVRIQTAPSNLISDLRLKLHAIQLSDLAYNTAKQSYEWDKIKYELGMIPKIHLDGSALAYQDAINKKASVEYDYYLARRALELAEQGILVGQGF